ncbi:uncharacterized protein LOC124285001 [Haliotis rubra]|uniref:uncharacterized protein LOC124285001 n=1 Tax=Haliotis rubra TaxID=36100 RepID=UPI001EE556A3|nr:uncharacterized protein LOC124285001 [Haliotis rubra]XP_046577099.1 uncharacterized protein LOC124285001 [Haliotis rubra]
MNDTRWRMNSTHCSCYLTADSDGILVKVNEVDDQVKMYLTMNVHRLRVNSRQRMDIVCSITQHRMSSIAPAERTCVIFRIQVSSPLTLDNIIRGRSKNLRYQS